MNFYGKIPRSLRKKKKVSSQKWSIFTKVKRSAICISPLDCPLTHKIYISPKLLGLSQKGVDQKFSSVENEKCHVKKMNMTFEQRLKKIDWQ